MAKRATLDRTRSYAEVHPADVVFYLQDHKEFDHNGSEILPDGEDTGPDTSYEEWAWKQLGKALKARTGKGPKPGMTKAEVIEALQALDAAEAVDDAPVGP